MHYKCALQFKQTIKPTTFYENTKIMYLNIPYNFMVSLKKAHMQKHLEVFTLDRPACAYMTTHKKNTPKLILFRQQGNVMHFQYMVHNLMLEFPQMPFIS
jgi:predicted GTPase